MLKYSSLTSHNQLTNSTKPKSYLGKQIETLQVYDYMSLNIVPVVGLVMMNIEVAIHTEDSVFWSGIIGLCPQSEQRGYNVDLYDFFRGEDFMADEQRLFQRNTLPYQIKYGGAGNA